jgi:hypothetical protein
MNDQGGGDNESLKVDALEKLRNGDAKAKGDCRSNLESSMKPEEKLAAIRYTGSQEQR